MALTCHYKLKQGGCPIQLTGMTLHSCSTNSQRWKAANMTHKPLCMITACVPWHATHFFHKAPPAPSLVGNSLSSVHQNLTSGTRDAYSETTMETEIVPKAVWKIGVYLLPESRRTGKKLFLTINREKASLHCLKKQRKVF